MPFLSVVIPALLLPWTAAVNNGLARTPQMGWVRLFSS